MTSEELQKRYHAAWWLARQKFPLIGVSLGTQKAFFDPITTIDAAQQWASETCVIEGNTTGEALFLSLCRQVSDSTKLAIVLDPIHGSRACVLNISHTILSLGGYTILSAFLTYMTDDECQYGLGNVFAPEDGELLIQKLPQSLSNAYSSQIAPPTEAQRRNATLIQHKAQERWSRTSIGIPIHSQYKARPSLIQNKQIRFEAAEFQAVLAIAKRENVTITAIFFACIVAGIHHRYGTGNEDGAHLIFSGNARRWLDTEGQNGQPPVALSIVPGAMWLDKACLTFGLNESSSLLSLAKSIQAAQDEDFASEHIIGVYDELAPLAAKATWDAQNGPLLVPAACRPTLTSQGPFGQRDPMKLPSHDRSQSIMRVSNFRTGGRNTEPSVCFALYSFNRELRCNLLFDEQFFDQDEVMQLMHVIAGAFRRMIALSERQGAAVKL